MRKYTKQEIYDAVEKARYESLDWKGHRALVALAMMEFNKLK